MGAVRKMPGAVVCPAVATSVDQGKELMLLHTNSIMRIFCPTHFRPSVLCIGQNQFTRCGLCSYVPGLTTFLYYLLGTVINNRRVCELY